MSEGTAQRVLAPEEQAALFEAARGARTRAYAPYSGFRVGAALLFNDGRIVTGANAENASYGLSLCAETAAVVVAMNTGRRGGLRAVAVVGGPEPAGERAGERAVTPCGRCRQVLAELAQLDGGDPLVLWVDGTSIGGLRLSALLPVAFGPASFSMSVGG
jgi:cytidine deaminase